MTTVEAQQDFNSVTPRTGPHPSFVQVAKPYVFEQSLQRSKTDVGASEAREDTIRLQGVTWIDNVRKSLHLPVRTYNTACVYYHKFRLIHPDHEYDYRDAAAAALFNACKIEDTLKKSRDILCAAYNLKLAPSEHLSSDDSLFEQHSKTILGLERLMLEASGFDFRNRYPQKMLMKLVKSCNLDRDTAGMTAYKICLDLYRTFAPLKQTTQTMALACLELAIRLREIDLSTVTTKYGFDYDRWATTREEIMETLVDILDLYIHHRTVTLIGPEYTLDAFIAVRITLNHEASDNKYPRFTEWSDYREKQEGKAESKPANGTPNGSTTMSPQSPLTSTAGERAKDGTIRFMLDPSRARDEKAIVKEFFEPPKEVEERAWIDMSENEAKQDPIKSSNYVPMSFQSGTMTMTRSSLVGSTLDGQSQSIHKLNMQLAKRAHWTAQKRRPRGEEYDRSNSEKVSDFGQWPTMCSGTDVSCRLRNKTHAVIQSASPLPQLQASAFSDRSGAKGLRCSSLYRPTDSSPGYHRFLQSSIGNVKRPQDTMQNAAPHKKNKEQTTNPNRIPIAPRSMNHTHSQDPRLSRNKSARSWRTLPPVHILPSQPMSSFQAEQ